MEHLTKPREHRAPLLGQEAYSNPTPIEVFGRGVAATQSYGLETIVDGRDRGDAGSDGSLVGA